MESNTWYHVAVTVQSSGSYNERVATFYINGKKSSESLIMTPFYEKEYPVTIGGCITGSCINQYLFGDLSHFSLWRGVLSEQKIHRLMFSVPNVHDEDLLGLFLFHETGFKLYDSSFNGMDGDVLGSAHYKTNQLRPVIFADNY